MALRVFRVAASTVLVVGLFSPMVTACGDGSGGGGDSTDGGDGDGDGDGDGVFTPLDPPTTVNGEHFASGQVCADCHSNDDTPDAMRDPDGNPIAPFDLWQGTMMANSARDPLWWAVVSAEAAATPSAATIIEAKCVRCHAPMLSDGLEDHEGLGLLDLRAGDDAAHLGLDGVSCTVCHQIQPDGLGTEGSFSGGWVIAAGKTIFGPHAMPFDMPMINRSGFTPAEATHVLDSSACATCHTLFTDAVDADANPIGDHFPEQTPYLEWRNSAFSTEVAQPGAMARSCQGCHVPNVSAAGAPLSTKIARRPGGGAFPSTHARAPVGRHVFVGGNTLIPEMLAANRDVLQPLASDAALATVRDAARSQLQTATATVSIAEATRAGDELTVTVAVQNLAGHKFPTGFPARRAWLHVTIRGPDGVAFESGGYDTRGQILGPDGAPLPFELAGGPLSPHHQTIDRERDVQIYESVMAGADQGPTYRLLRATSYAKDNRLLPAGWRADGPDAEATAPTGIGDDADFGAAGDAVQYRASAPASGGPYTVEIALVYQPVSERYTAELLTVDTPAVASFGDMYAASDPAPEMVASVATSLP